MQDTTKGSTPPLPSLTVAAAQTSGRVRARKRAWARASAVAITRTDDGSAMARLRRRGSWLQVHPSRLAIGAIILLGLVGALGALAGCAGTSTSSLAPSGTSIEETTINTIRTVDPSVVQVQARGSGSSGGVGSGEILTTSGYIVTNDHVVRGLTSFSVLLADGRQIAARLVGEAPTQDLAVLKISARNLKPIAVGDSSKVLVGEYALAIGSPLGLEQSATSGIISALNRQANTDVDGQVVTMTGLIQTSAPINPGNSGGALVNLRGELIGIPTLGAVEPSSGVAANGIGFAISSNRMATIVKQLTGGAA